MDAVARQVAGLPRLGITKRAAGVTWRPIGRSAHRLRRTRLPAGRRRSGSGPSPGPATGAEPRSRIPARSSAARRPVEGAAVDRRQAERAHGQPTGRRGEGEERQPGAMRRAAVAGRAATRPAPAASPSASTGLAMPASTRGAPGTARARRWRRRARRSARRSRRASRCGARSGSLRLEASPEGVHGRRADAVDLVELVDRRGAAVLIAELDDLLGGHRPDPLDRVELLDGRGAEADRARSSRRHPSRGRPQQGLRPCWA